MEYQDYYAALGVDKNAAQDEIKRVYRKLARKYHPDLSKEAGAEDKFKEISEAYEVLGDPEKRAAYDQLGTGNQTGEDFQPPPGWNEGFEFSGGFPGGRMDTGTTSDFFEHLFGGQNRSGRPQAHTGGRDHHAKILIDLDDVFKGATRSIQLKMPKVTPDGHVTTELRTLNVKIPKGVRQGQHIRLKGQGSLGHGQGNAGDLYLEVEFSQHRIYHVDGRDIYLDLPVAPWEAALGGKVKTPTPVGPVDVSIPPNSKQGGKLRLKGRGIPGKPSGDLYIVLQIALPIADSAKAKNMYQTMADELAFEPRAGLGV